MLIYNLAGAVFVGLGRFLGHAPGPERHLRVIAGIQASDGKFYRYPITIRFIQ
jgi:hypothetical protein